MDSQPYHNRRDLPRYRLNLEVAVYNEMTGKELGKLVDVHGGGLMLISLEQISADCLYQVQLQPACPEQSIAPIALGVDCMWSHAREQQGGCWAGFQIIDASPQALQQLQALIEMFGESEES